MIVAFAELEKDLISSRTTKGRAMKAKDGGFSGGAPKFGYRVVDKELVVDEDEATVVKGMFFRRSEGCTYAQITEELNNSGITTRRGNKWYPAQVKGILDGKRFYCGEYKYSDGDWVKGKHQPIL